MNQGWIYREQVKLTDAGQTVLAYYTKKYRHSTEFEWTERINSGQILLNQRLVKTTAIIQHQDQLVYHRQPWIEPDVPLNFDVIYEDQELMVVNKPSGLPVLSGGGFLEHTLLWQLRLNYPQYTPVPIHRLGRGTSGLVLLARTSLAKSHLARQMRNSTLNHKQGSIRKVYRALVSNGSRPILDSLGDRFTINQAIGKIPHPKLDYIFGATSEGKHAQSICQVICQYEDYSLLEIEILTGRPHQIRIHLAAVGYPLLNDPLYISGGGFAEIESDQKNIPVPGDCGYFLHATKLSLLHPQTNQTMDFICPLPESWLAKI